ncbi:MAG: hypothetical protein EXR48_07565 [Dehalococcoidia bacterium]|nr:hypothetical protein [Dehalococcoidia bacterium]
MIPLPKGKRWGRGHSHKVLTSRFYTGTLTWGGNGKYHRAAKLTSVVVRNAVPALVDEAIFQHVQESLKARAPNVTHSRRVASPDLLSGQLRCEVCGAAMFGISAKQGRFRYYTCATAFLQWAAGVSWKVRAPGSDGGAGAGQSARVGVARGPPGRTDTAYK